MSKNLVAALSVAKNRRKKPKKMAEGGEVKNEKKEPLYKDDGGAFKGVSVDQDKAKKVMKAFGYAKGGEVAKESQGNPKLQQSMKSIKSGSISEAIRKKKKMMAEGGLVEHNDDLPDMHEFNEMALEDQTSPEIDISQPIDSNEILPDAEEANMNDMHMIDRIRLRIKKRNG